MTSTDGSTTASPRSRPRVGADREQEILDAALEVLREVGYDKLTIDTVAARARASKATLYRRWPGKADLVADAMSQLDGGEPALPDTGTLRGDLLAMADARIGGILDPGQMDLVCGLSTAMHRDRALGVALRGRFIDPRRNCVRVLLERARDRGEVADGVDLELVGQIVPAIIMFRLSFGPVDEPFEALVRQIVDDVVLPAVRNAGGRSPDG
ncbi:MAG: TetR/AcrR family transcriptional regulator [Kineosporiaceae bacterium]